MDEAKKMTKEELDEIAFTLNFNPELLAKDYHITVALYLMKDIKGIYFKGGTALQKIFLNHSRLSEDIDFTLTRDIRLVKKEITKILEKSTIFNKLTLGKEVKGFTRIILNYNDMDGKPGALFIDLNKRAKLLTKPEMHRISHFYKGFIPEFSFQTLSQDEMIAEKIAAAINRNKPRDHYDIYKIIEKKIPIRLGLAKEKCQQEGSEFSIIRMFNQAKKLKNRWDKDMAVLIRDKVTFQKVITTLAKHFKLKEEKDKLRKKK